MAAGERTRIAIACQGDGSHTALTAGMLKRLLGDDDARERFELAGLSGTSGGAICALLAWYGLADEDPDRPGRLLDVTNRLVIGEQAGEAFSRPNSRSQR